MCIFNILSVVFDFLDDVMIHWMETSLEGYMGKIWKITRNCYQNGGYPVNRSRTKCFNKDFICIPRGYYHSIEQDEQIPHGDTTPDEKVLDPSEMAHCEGNLTIYCPYDASKHGGSYSSHIGSLAAGAECLVIEDDEIEEESN